MDKDKEGTLQVAKGGKPQKGKGRPRGGNSPVIGDNGLKVDAGDNSRYLGFALLVSQMQPIDTADPVQVEIRIDEYFRLCVDNDMKPTVSGLAMALGVDRRTLWEWKSGHMRLSTHSDLIKKAYNIMENLWEGYMQNGKIHPVAGIFLGKNHYGYVDKQEHVFTANNPLGPELTEEEIERRVKALPPLDDDLTN